MKEAPKPANEAERLAALRSYQVLDTLPEESYDDLTFVAAEMCQTPIAIISLVDDCRQWFKSRVGLDEPETPRDIAFCSHAILHPKEMMVVEDTLLDPRFAHNPLVTSDPKLRFYAGAPLVTSDGHALGTLCVIDRVPRQLTERQLAGVRALARQVVAQLELRRANQLLRDNAQFLEKSNQSLEKRSLQLERSRDALSGLCEELETQSDRMERDLSRAETIQRSLMPHHLPELEGYRVHSFYRPGHGIGGDLFDVAVLDDRHVALVIADASGHGVSAAMISVLFKHRLRMVDPKTKVPLQPARALTTLNQALFTDLPRPGGMFVTAVYGLLDITTGELTVASAGHPPILVLRASGGFDTIEHTGPALGLGPEARFEEHRCTLGRGDQLLLYTDGLLDTGAPSPPKVGELEQAVRAHQPTTPKLLERVWKRLSQDGEPEDRDDVTMLLLQAESGVNESTEAAEAVATNAPCGRTPARITRGEGAQDIFLCLEGRITWLMAQSLLDAGTTAIEKGRGLVVDLTQCEYLDSTLLGTLYELVQRAEQHGTSIKIQHASEELKHAFDELCMNSVLDQCCVEALPLPKERKPLATGSGSATEQRMRILHAHQVLADLSEENRSQFGDMLRLLRAEIDRSDSA